MALSLVSVTASEATERDQELLICIALRLTRSNKFIAISIALSLSGLTKLISSLTVNTYSSVTFVKTKFPSIETESIKISLEKRMESIPVSMSRCVSFISNGGIGLGEGITTREDVGMIDDIITCEDENEVEIVAEEITVSKDIVDADDETIEGATEVLIVGEDESATEVLIVETTEGATDILVIETIRDMEGDKTEVLVVESKGEGLGGTVNVTEDDSIMEMTDSEVEVVKTTELLTLTRMVEEGSTSTGVLEGITTGTNTSFTCIGLVLFR